MKKKLKNEKLFYNQRKIYTRPEVDFTLIEMEEKIATGSAIIDPGRPIPTVDQQWDRQPDLSEDGDW
ncbi:hypothetical protein GNY06_01340 [Elizabethkingia argentiflava]|uniref:Uncharacterized protein n=1 Tax=Elizabethkingia argenteiflava TaxID=2681556 RepID=A0A845PVF5_9FLAO|nr:hypothetical protein [Elizabethkingia argenteiflava]NAW50090.1 hypothetical protein [Elizabethkingia argenteiflava]